MSNTVALYVSWRHHKKNKYRHDECLRMLLVYYSRLLLPRVDFPCELLLLLQLSSSRLLHHRIEILYEIAILVSMLLYSTLMFSPFTCSGNTSLDSHHANAFNQCVQGTDVESLPNLEEACANSSGDKRI